MSTSKVIVILGATGNQGGSVAEAFLSEPDWRVRAITRNAKSSKAQALSSKGTQVVQADLDEPSTLVAAFEGANAIFAVSDFWGLYSDLANKSRAKPGQPLNQWAAEHEEQQLKNKWSKGKYTRVYHFDGKARAAEYIPKAQPDLWAKTSVFQAGLFLSNFVQLPLNQPIKVSRHFLLQEIRQNNINTQNTEGVAQFISPLDPDTKFPFIAAEEDSGPIVKALIIQEPAGHNLIGYREWLTSKEIAESFTKATGIESAAVKSDGTFPPGFSEEFVGEMKDCFGYFNEFGYEGRDDPTIVHPRDLKSAPKLGTAEDYFMKQDWSKVFNS
ncbi:hypothetical protein FVEN_g5814 [Fusarium venenatum]|nr:hypothetical protein FVEN_g5814 [Fusarium venenatum]